MLESNGHNKEANLYCSGDSATLIHFYVLTGQQTDSNKWFGGSDRTARALFIGEWHHENRELGEKL